MQSNQSGPALREMTLLSHDKKTEKNEQLDIDPALWAGVEQAAKLEGISPMELILEAIRDKVNRSPSLNRKAPKPGKGWIAVNLASYVVEELHLACEITGEPFGRVCAMALRRELTNLSEQIGVSSYNLRDLSKAERAKKADRIAQLRYCMFVGGGYSYQDN
jgi:hypothetical protein